MKSMTCRYGTVFLLGTLLLLSAAVPARADSNSNARTFLDAAKRYETGNYAAAAEGFQKLVDGGIHNGKLYFNLANAYLKQNRLGLAILWYERARRLIPEDPDLNFNLAYAQSRLKDEPGTFGSPVLQVLFFWKNLLGVPAWQWVGVVAAAIFWCLWAAALRFKKPALKPLMYGVLALALLASGTAIYRSHASILHPRAVILGKSVAVRSGFSADTTQLFVLHEGTLVAVEKQTDGYLKIRYAKDKIGWVSTKMAKII